MFFCKLETPLSHGSAKTGLTLCFQNGDHGDRQTVFNGVNKSSPCKE